VSHKRRRYTSDVSDGQWQRMQWLLPKRKKGGRQTDGVVNAMVESFFSPLRVELTDLERFATRQAARTAVCEFIEVFYNPQRLPSALGCHSPLTFEASHLS
jgi:putative transposase